MQVALYPGTPGFSLLDFREKLIEETGEVLDELVAIHYSDPDDIDFVFLLEEIFDVMQTCYSFLRSNFTLDEIGDANIDHLDKMRERYAKNN